MFHQHKKTLRATHTSILDVYTFKKLPKSCIFITSPSFRLCILVVELNKLFQELETTFWHHSAENVVGEFMKMSISVVFKFIVPLKYKKKNKKWFYFNHISCLAVGTFPVGLQRFLKSISKFGNFSEFKKCANIFCGSKRTFFSFNFITCPLTP